ncbi:MAG: adenylate kinase [Salinisphaeraceae bacterium]|nr:adenylate kinase [Salinisphaeraceae bacterium]
MRLVFLGAPGSGKGTQARRLMDEYASPQISTGDLLRAAVADGSELGKKAKAAMDAGELVADDIVIGMIRERLHQKDTQYGFILDGFPRSLAQAEALDEMLAEEGKPLHKAVLLDVDMDGLVKRLTGRRTCSQCGHLYNVYYNPPKKEGVCDHDSAELQHRADDNVETITSRMDVYQKQTEPLVKYYEGQGILERVDGDGEMNEVYRRIQKAIGEAAG